MRVLFYESSLSDKGVELVGGLAGKGVVTEHVEYVGFADIREVALTLSESHALNYDALVINADSSDLGTFLPRVLRNEGAKIPFILLTNQESETRIKFLYEGASCCVPLEIALDELLAIIKAQVALYSSRERKRITHLGNVLVDHNRGLVSVRREQEGIIPVELTTKEYFVLDTLAQNAGRTMSKEAILSNMYMLDTPELKIVDVFVCKIRRKLAQAGAEGEIIQTVWGQGYKVESSTSNQNAAQ